MDYLDLFKRAFRITWRYRPLWIFGLFLALCSGGSGGGGGSNFNPPTGSFRDVFEGNLPGLPEIDSSVIIALVVGAICLFLILIILGVVVPVVTRTALIAMVSQIQETERVTVNDGWQMGWSAKAWRLFLVSLLIGIPVAVVSLFLIILALAPLLLILLEETVFIVIGVTLTVFAVLFVILLLILVSIIVGPIREIAWRRTVLEQRGVIDSLVAAVGLIRNRLKDVVIIWLLMFGVAIGWAIVSFVLVLPVSLIAALVVGGVPAGLVYLISNSGLGAAIAGIPLGLLTLILITSVAQGFYLIFQSTVWTLTYLEVREVAPEQIEVSDPNQTHEDG